MPYNGAGVFERLYSWVQDLANGIRIRADRMDAEMDGMATALSNVITRDGQTTITTDIPWAGNRITGLGVGTADGDAISMGQTGAKLADGLRLASTDGSADAGPVLDLDRASATPAASDVIGGVAFNGRDSAANKTTYGQWRASIVSPTDGAESGRLDLDLLSSGTLRSVFSVEQTGKLALRNFDAGAGGGPYLSLMRDSASPAADDELGVLEFAGRDSDGNAQPYLSILTNLVDPTSGSEDSRMDIFTTVAGTHASRMSLGAGVRIGAADDKGSGTINAQLGVYDGGMRVGGDGTIVQTSYATYTANADITASIPYDDTVPQVGEGTQIISVTHTPLSTANKLRVRFRGLCSADGAAIVTAAIFGTGSNNARGSEPVTVAGLGYEVPMSITAEWVPGSTSPQTIQVRVGVSSGTARFNGTTAGRVHGGAIAATLEIEEIKAT